MWTFALVEFSMEENGKLQREMVKKIPSDEINKGCAAGVTLGSTAERPSPAPTPSNWA